MENICSLIINNKIIYLQIEKFLMHKGLKISDRHNQIISIIELLVTDILS